MNLMILIADYKQLKQQQLQSVQSVECYYDLIVLSFLIESFKTDLKIN